MDACLGTSTRSACAPHKEQVKAPCGGGEGKQESRAADALMGIRLCCCLLEEAGERSKGWGERRNERG